MRSGRAAAGVVVAGAAGYTWLHRLGRTPGSTRAERAASLPGDTLVADPQVVTDHAITIAVPASAVWPWLVQVGWDRGGWYTARWVDALVFPANGPAADRIHPEWQQLAVGDRVLDGPPQTECFFVVAQLESEQHLVLHSRSHLPPGFRDRYHAGIDWSWAFVLRDVGDGRTRLHVRTRVRLVPRWLAAGYSAALVPADRIMATQMLHGLKNRAEGHHLGDDPRGLRRVRDTVAALGLMAVSPLIRPWHLQWGATAAEVRVRMPGDDILTAAQFRATRAVTIDAPPDAVWPWLLQVGFHRAGFYSYDLLDNLGRPSSDRILQQWQHLDLGDTVAPMADPPTAATAFTIAEMDPPHQVVWIKPDSTWSWKFTRIDRNRTRLVTRLKVRYRPRLDALLTVLLIEFGDFAMMRRMLLTLRRRASHGQALP
jgi:hypothetical protein